MKTKKIFTLLTLFLLAITLNSCVEDGDYSIPNITIKKPNINATHSIKDIKEMYKGNAVNLSELNNGKAVIQGYVVSSDEAGNIYKSIAIQDKPENPTTAIQIVVDATKTGLYYQVGRKVYVKLKGLGIDKYKGVLQLGKLEGTEVKRIPDIDYKQIIIRDTELAKITPLSVKSIKDINDSMVSMLIKLDNMHAVNKNETFADTKSKYPTNRTFQNCENKQKIVMRNSNYASFATEKIPNKRGAIIAVLGKYDKTYQLLIRDDKDLIFTENYNCEGENTNNNGEQIDIINVNSLNEPFNSVENKKDVAIKGWTVKAIKGDRKWQGKEFKNNKFISIGAYKAKSESIEAWIITPGLNLSEAKNKNFTFKSQRSYSQNETLEVLVSTNFNPNKDFSEAKWEKLNPNLAPKSSNYSPFVEAGNLNLSKYNGIIHIAFKYVGNNKNATGSFAIDEVKFNYNADNSQDNNNNNQEKATELYFSEYAEGSANNKYIEIYNGTDKDINLSDYKIELFDNGKKEAKNILEFSKINTDKILKKGTAFVVYNAGSNEVIKKAGNISSTVTYFNGDDAIVLKKNNIIIDVIGNVGEKKVWKVAGVNNATKDHTLIRKLKINKGNTNWNESAGTNADDSEWEVKNKDDFSSIGKR